MTNPNLFKEQKYLTFKGLVPLNLCKVITKYALLKEQHEFEPDLGPHAQVENAHAVYGDTLMETMLYFLHSHMEQNTGLSLCPTYSYYRVYRPGMLLAKHLDRPSCEISTTICFGFDYKEVDQSYRWGMYVGDKTLVLQDAGDLIVYRGCEVEHWREPFNAGLNSYQVQAFFHYIDKNSNFYPEYAYDRRPSLGYKNK
jgi:hypothetical protein